ncbi:SH3 domain-containing protein [Streptomyces sp. NPDC088337]|uniref:SH3 domain-containing protein n=1 Tax=unclassified Streptomyces TaxID=2593676 RepID=UPI002DD7F91D|nr:SH3 domain-containing protein [Streptomyces sp. NBC_01788]WSB28004.1 SH3 domain-containing protein [Streptomyces sp. NBC_01788]
MSVDRAQERVVESAAERSGELIEQAGGDAATVVAAAAALNYYPVAPGVELNVRSGPGTGYGIVRTLSAGASVPIYCQTPGTTVSGYYGTSNIWNNIGTGQYVSDTYVKTGSDGYVTGRCG